MARMSSVERRIEIVHAALRVIERDGVHAATTRAIVAEAHMPLGSFHYAFSSRDEMMHELIAQVVEGQTVAAFSTLQFGDDVRSIVRQALEAFFRTIVENPGQEQVLFELMVYSMRTPRLASLPREQWANYRSAAEELLTFIAANAGVRWSVPVADLAHMVVAITDGLTLSWLANRDEAAAAIVMDIAASSFASLAVPLSETVPPISPTKDISV
jgi:DNA-binding transcriptional regulator YbjK